MLISLYSGTTANKSWKQNSRVNKLKTNAVLSAQAKYRIANVIAVPQKSVEVFLNLHFQADKLPQDFQKMACL